MVRAFGRQGMESGPSVSKPCLGQHLCTQHLVDGVKKNPNNNPKALSSAFSQESCLAINNTLYGFCAWISQRGAPENNTRASRRNSAEFFWVGWLIADRIFSSVQSLSRVQLFMTPWTAAHQLPCPSPTPGACSNSCPSSQRCHLYHLILCHPLLFLPSIFPSIRVFSSEPFFPSGGQSIGGQ